MFDYKEVAGMKGRSIVCTIIKDVDKKRDGNVVRRSQDNEGDIRRRSQANLKPGDEVRLVFLFVMREIGQ